MINEINYEAYFYLSSSKLNISIFQLSDQKKIFNNQIQIKTENVNSIDFGKIDEFLEKNISSIEKLTKNFLNSIYLIIENNNSIPIDVSLKINNDGNLIEKKDVQYLLIDAKQQIIKSYENSTINHIIIKNYNFDENSFSYFPKNKTCKQFSIDMRFICLPNKIIKKLNDLFAKNQISINKIICAKYLRSLLEYNEMENEDICKMGFKINRGLNTNEVILKPRNHQKKGFFEKFFHFFQ